MNEVSLSACDSARSLLRFYQFASRCVVFCCWCTCTWCIERVSSTSLSVYFALLIANVLFLWLWAGCGMKWSDSTGSVCFFPPPVLLHQTQKLRAARPVCARQFKHATSSFPEAVPMFISVYLASKKNCRTCFCCSECAFVISCYFLQSCKAGDVVVNSCSLQHKKID